MQVVSQDFLVSKIFQLFPNHKILVDTRKAASLQNKHTLNYLELDVWIPDLNIAFEYQDSYHYITTWYHHQQHSSVVIKDEMKREKAQQTGITLITVPCWWSGTAESLSSAISYYRPDLFALASEDEPISLNPPDDFFPKRELPHIGELAAVSFPSSTNFIHDFPKNTWWINEKYDGIRCCWNAYTGNLYTRHNKKISLISSVASRLPQTSLDGELWAGRGLYDTAFSCAISSQFWNDTRFLWFDAPSPPLQSLPYEMRYHHTINSISDEDPISIVTPRLLCIDGKHLSELTSGVIVNDGEGVILQKILSRYSHGRTPDLIKLKGTVRDKDGLIVKVDDSSLSIKLAGGEVFDVPVENVMVKPLPVKGDVVTFSFEMSNNRDLPLNPKIVRIRRDVTWSDTILNTSPDDKLENLPMQLRLKSTKKEPVNMRAFAKQFFIRFAESKKFCWKDPSNWHSLLTSQIKSFDGGHRVLSHFGSLYDALKATFPELSFPAKSLFRYRQWDDPQQRRLFFEKFAKKHNFDALVPANWKGRQAQIMMEKNARVVLSYYGLSVYKALKNIFTEVKWVKSSAKSDQKTKGDIGEMDNQNNEDILVTSTHWEDPTNRRELFTQFAYEHDFDPFVPTNWDMQSSKLLKYKNIKNILQHHSNSIFRALKDLFPNVDWTASDHFQNIIKKQALQHVGNRRKYLEDFARDNQFDPLVAENWRYQASRFRDQEYARCVLGYHGNSMVRALHDLFNEVNWPVSSLNQKVQLNSMWQNPENRRQYFIEHASKHGFDPLIPENWMGQHTIVKVAKYGQSVISFHGNSVANALRELFPEVNWK